MGKWSKYPRKYCVDWEKDEKLKDWIAAVPGDEGRAFCKFCRTSFRAHHHDLLGHMKTTKHKKHSPPSSGMQEQEKGYQCEMSQLSIKKKDCSTNDFGMERWKGRVALVTGASAGIGAAMCRKLVNYGIKVIGCDKNIDGIMAVALENDVMSASGKIRPIKCDLTQEAEILAMFKEIKKVFGHVDVCINNAGLNTAKSSLLGGNTSDWREIFDVNVMALCICTREAVKLMRANDIDDGQIININSMASHRIPSAGLNFYSGTKFMVHALTEGVRHELRALKSHIRVANISPGLVETEFANRMTDYSKKARELCNSMTCLQAENIASAMISILQTPPHVDINDILVRPVEQFS